MVENWEVALRDKACMCLCRERRGLMCDRNIPVCDFSLVREVLCFGQLVLVLSQSLVTCDFYALSV